MWTAKKNQCKKNNWKKQEHNQTNISHTHKNNNKHINRKKKEKKCSYGPVLLGTIKFCNNKVKNKYWHSSTLVRKEGDQFERGPILDARGDQNRPGGPVENEAGCLRGGPLQSSFCHELVPRGTTSEGGPDRMLHRHTKSTSGQEFPAH